MKSVEDLMLLDFYGNLLTDKMRDALDLYLNDDLSITEIAAECDISRQGAHDTVKRAMQQLKSYEDKLGLVARFSEQKKSVEKAVELIDRNEIDKAREVLLDLRDEIEG